MSSANSRFRTIETEDDLREGVAYLCQREPLYGKVFAATGLPPLRRKRAGLGGLLEVITEQQISVHAAAAIWQRVEAKCAPFDAQKLADMDDSEYVACGLSRPKIRTIRAILAEILNGKLSLTNMETAENSQIFESLTRVKGIGPWTAQIYLLSNLGRMDVWPAGDLALQESARLLFGLDARPGEKEMLALAEPWQPWRAVAARLLWSHYRLVRFEGGSI